MRHRRPTSNRSSYLLLILFSAASLGVSTPAPAAEPEVVSEFWSAETRLRFATLLNDLQQESSEGRCQAVYALAEEPFREIALNELRRSLVNDRDELVRRAVAHVLWSGPYTADEAALPELEHALGDSSAAVRLRAALELADLIAEVSGQISSLGQDNDQTRLNHLRAIKSRLDVHPDPTVRGLLQFGWAAYFPSEPPGPDIDKVVPLIFSAIELERTAPLPRPTKEPGRWWNFREFRPIRLFAYVGPAAKSAVPLLQREWESFQEFPTGNINQNSAPADRAHGVLSSFVRIGAPAVPALRESLKSRHETVRRVSAMALAFIEPTSSLPVPMLIESLRGDCWGYCYGTNTHRIDADALAELGDVAIPLLVDAVRKDGTMEVHAAAVLSKLAPQASTVEVLLRSLQDESPKIRFLAAVGLGHQGREAATARDALRKLLADDSQQVRDAAKEAIERIEKALQRESVR